MRPTPRIIGGQVASPGTFAFSASLQSWNEAVCGAALISPERAVTAAHCIVPSSIPHGRYSLLVFRHNLSAPDVHQCDQYLSVTAAAIHPAYDSSTFVADVALLTISAISGSGCQTLASSSYPTLDASTAVDQHAGQDAITMGWGSTSYSAATDTSGNVSDVLREVTVPLQPDAICRGALPHYVTPEMLCAGRLAGGHDACAGDSGGPLVLPPSATNPRHTLVGVSSWGYGCGVPGNPGVYTRVAHFSSWLFSAAGFQPSPPQPPVAPPPPAPTSPPAGPPAPPAAPPPAPSAPPALPPVPHSPPPSASLESSPAPASSVAPPPPARPAPTVPSLPPCQAPLPPCRHPLPPMAPPGGHPSAAEPPAAALPQRGGSRASSLVILVAGTATAGVLIGLAAAALLVCIYLCRRRRLAASSNTSQEPTLVVRAAKDEASNSANSASCASRSAVAATSSSSI